VNPTVRSWLRHLKTIVLLLIVICVLWRLRRGVNWNEVRHSFAQANALLLATAMVASGSTNLLRACRWRALLSPLVPMNIHDTFAATNIGMGGSFVFGSAVGELIRPLTLPLLNRRVRPAVSFLTVLVERLCDLSVLSIFFGLTLLWLPVIGSHAITGNRIRDLGVILLLWPVLGVCVFVLLARRFSALPTDRDYKSVGVPTGNKIGRAVARLFNQLARALGLLSNKREFIEVTLWTIAFWLTNVFTNWLTVRAFGLELGPKETLLVVCCGLVGSLVPTPGGAAGAYHLAISGGLIFLGIEIERAAAISIAAHLVGFLPALLIGTYYLLRGSVNIAQLRRQLSAANHPSGD
jgi:uncharacterized protein (TIRG00374 family)